MVQKSANSAPQLPFGANQADMEAAYMPQALEHAERVIETEAVQPHSEPAGEVPQAFIDLKAKLDEQAPNARVPRPLTRRQQINTWQAERDAAKYAGTQQ